MTYLEKYLTSDIEENCEDKEKISVFMCEEVFVDNQKVVIDKPLRDGEMQKLKRNSLRCGL